MKGLYLRRKKKEKQVNINRKSDKFVIKLTDKKKESQKNEKY